MRRFVVGDIHGAFKALLQVFDRSKFDKDNDLLICLGDVCDGWPFVKDCIDFLTEIKNLIYILGNHDIEPGWAFDWLSGRPINYSWWTQGGKATVESFFPFAHLTPLKARQLMPEDKYREFFKQGKLYHIINDDSSPDTLFVHGGINPNFRAEVQIGPPGDFFWDRDLFYGAIALQKKGCTKLTKHNRVFIGHTALETNFPQKFCEVWNMDTGAGWNGVLSIMDIDSEEYWVSDPVKELYPNIKGR